MAIGRTVWGSRIPTLKGTEAYIIVLCTLFPISSINVYIFHITWLDTFWTDLVYLQSSLFKFFFYKEMS